MRVDAAKLNGKCECGETHEMNTTAAIIEHGVSAGLPDILNEYGISGTCAAIYDENTYDAKNLVRPKADFELILDPANLHANEKAVGKAMPQLEGKSFDYLIAVGSGTIHDTTRYCAHKLGIPFVSMPTAASVDGFCSTVCAMTWEGCKKTIPGVAPSIVVADTNVIKEAPLRLQLSGIGDIIGKYTALADWKISAALQGEHFCDRICKMTMDAVEEVYKCAEKVPARDEDAIANLTYALVLSGLAMQLMGNSRPASGAEHHISHAIEMEAAAIALHSDGLHGEKVGVGTIMISDYYHKLAAIEDIGNHVKPYEFYSTEELRDFWGDALLKGILSENEADPMDGVTTEMLVKTWPKIQEIIAEIPTAEELRALYTRIGMKQTLPDIDIPEKFADELIYFSPSVRKRTTFNRISRMIEK